MIEALCILLLGWSLGMLSPWITERVSNRYKKKSLQCVILNELKDLKMRLVLLPFMVNSDYGTLDRELVIWTEDETQKLEELKLKDESNEYLKKLIKNEKELQENLAYYNSINKKDKPAFHFKKMTTSTIDSNFINIGLLDNDFVTKLLEIRFQLNAFNEEIDNVNEYMKMTFDSNISVENHRIVSENIKRKNLIISKKAIYIVDKINKIINPSN